LQQIGCHWVTSDGAKVMHEAPESVSNGDIRRSDANRDQAADLRFRRFPSTAANRSTSWHQ
jgi:hypothetical protein